MAKYLLAYHGGHVDETPDGIQRVMGEFAKWFGELGAAVLDPGYPVSATRTVTPDGNINEGGGPNPVSGYTVLELDSMDRAIDWVKRGPIIQGGRSVEICETMNPLE
jgi:hypothetical protein